MFCDQNAYNKIRKQEYLLKFKKIKVGVFPESLVVLSYKAEPVLFQSPN